MHEPYFERLKTNLAEQGISARYIDRLITELEDHCADVAAEWPGGADPTAGRDWLRDRLGHEGAIVSQVLARPELRGRLSGLRAAARLVAAQHVGADRHHGEIAQSPVMRWSASIACGTMITAALLLAMAQSIALTV